MQFPFGFYTKDPKHNTHNKPTKGITLEGPDRCIRWGHYWEPELRAPIISLCFKTLGPKLTNYQEQAQVQHRQEGFHAKLRRGRLGRDEYSLCQSQSTRGLVWMPKTCYRRLGAISSLPIFQDIKQRNTRPTFPALAA